VEELQNTQATLELKNKELAALGSQFARAAQRAAIGEFSAGVAHSMNNPMAALSSALRQINHRVDKHNNHDLSCELERFFTRAGNAVRRMETIVDAVRRAHKSGSLPSTAQCVNLADELRTALSLFEGRFEQVKLETDFAENPIAWIPPDAFHHVVANLIDNALCALAGQGRLRLRLSSNEHWVCLDVADNGPGLPEHVRTNLFEPFVSGREDGTGLGLSMASRLTRQWQGELIYEALDPGTRFQIRMPLPPEQGLTIK
jgi:signal transduction histidine kinase